MTHNKTRKPHTAFITSTAANSRSHTRTLFAVNFHSFVSFRQKYAKREFVAHISQAARCETKRKMKNRTSVCQPFVSLIWFWALLMNVIYPNVPTQPAHSIPFRQLVARLIRTSHGISCVLHHRAWQRAVGVCAHILSVQIGITASWVRFDGGCTAVKWSQCTNELQTNRQTSGKIEVVRSRSDFSAIFEAYAVGGSTCVAYACDKY